MEVLEPQQALWAVPAAQLQGQSATSRMVAVPAELLYRPVLPARAVVVQPARMELARPVELLALLQVVVVVAPMEVPMEQLAYQQLSVVLEELTLLVLDLARAVVVQ